MAITIGFAKHSKRMSPEGTELGGLKFVVVESTLGTELEAKKGYFQQELGIFTAARQVKWTLLSSRVSTHASLGIDHSTTYI